MKIEDEKDIGDNHLFFLIAAIIILILTISIRLFA